VRLDQMLIDLQGAMADARALGFRQSLDRVLGAAAEEIMAARGIPVMANSPGIYVVEFKDSYDLNFFYDMLNRLPRQVGLAVFMNPAVTSRNELRAMNRLARASQGRMVVPEFADMSSLNAFVSQYMKTEAVRDILGAEVEDLIQVMTGVGVEADYLKAALLGAVPLAEGRIVVAGDEKLSLSNVNVFTMTLAEMVETALRTRQAVRESA